ncbi:MAG: hypothetical protein R2854_25130 [Caldilineaceae bacterium]
MIEYSWALTGIVGLFVVGQLIAGGTAGAHALSAAGRRPGVWVRWSWAGCPVPATGMVMPAEQAARLPFTQRAVAFFDLGEHAGSTYATIVAAAFNFFAAMQLMVIYGVWLGDQYGLGAAQLGARWRWSSGCSIWRQRLGQSLHRPHRQAAQRAGGRGRGHQAKHPHAVQLQRGPLRVCRRHRRGDARSCFEFSIVSNFPLLSEQAPAHARKVMTLRWP